MLSWRLNNIFGKSFFCVIFFFFPFQNSVSMAGVLAWEYQQLWACFWLTTPWDLGLESCAMELVAAASAVSCGLCSAPITPGCRSEQVLQPQAQQPPKGGMVWHQVGYFMIIQLLFCKPTWFATPKQRTVLSMDACRRCSWGRGGNGKVWFFKLDTLQLKIYLIDVCFIELLSVEQLVIVFSTVQIWIETVLMTNHYYTINKTLSRLCWSTEHKTNSKF